MIVSQMEQTATNERNEVNIDNSFLRTGGVSSSNILFFTFESKVCIPCDFFCMLRSFIVLATDETDTSETTLSSSIYISISLLVSSKTIWNMKYFICPKEYDSSVRYTLKCVLRLFGNSFKDIFFIV